MSGDSRISGQWANPRASPSSYGGEGERRKEGGRRKEEGGRRKEEGGRTQEVGRRKDAGRKYEAGRSECTVALVPSKLLGKYAEIIQIS
jgi:hypothetical protein